MRYYVEKGWLEGENDMAWSDPLATFNDKDEAIEYARNHVPISVEGEGAIRVFDIKDNKTVWSNLEKGE